MPDAATTEPREILARFPKQRPALPAAHRRIYEREYRRNRARGGALERLVGAMEAWMHRRVASLPGEPLLELGAGTLNHLPFEAAVRDYDVVEPFRALFADSPLLPRVRHVFDDLSEIPSSLRYRRIVSVAVLEHMERLPRELARAGLLLDAGGVLQAGIPSEGGLLWWLGWRATTGLGYFVRHRLDYGVLMRHEHVNTAPEIVALLRWFFRDVRVRRFPTPWHALSLYAYLEARSPHEERCAAYLRDGGPQA